MNGDSQRRSMELEQGLDVKHFESPKDAIDQIKSFKYDLNTPLLTEALKKVSIENSKSKLADSMAMDRFKRRKADSLDNSVFMTNEGPFEIDAQKKKKLMNLTLRQPKTCLRIGCLSRYRALCFKFRLQMVLSNVFWAMSTSFIGIFFVVPAMLSMILFYNVLTSPSGTPTLTLLYFKFENSLSAAISPFVSSFTFFFFLTILSWLSHLHDMLHQGLFVWNRDVLGFHL